MADSRNLPPATTTPLTFKKQNAESESDEKQDLRQANGAHRYIPLTEGEDKKELERMLNNINQIILYCQEQNISGADRWATVKGNFVMDSPAYNAWLELEAAYPQNQNKTNPRLVSEMIPAFIDHVLGSFANGDQLLKYLRNAKLTPEWYAPKWMARLKQLYKYADSMQHENPNAMPDDDQKKQYFMDNLSQEYQLELRSKAYDTSQMDMTEIAREIGLYQQKEMMKQNKVLSTDGLMIVPKNDNSSERTKNSRKRKKGDEDERDEDEQDEDEQEDDEHQDDDDSAQNQEHQRHSHDDESDDDDKLSFFDKPCLIHNNHPYKQCRLCFTGRLFNKAEADQYYQNNDSRSQVWWRKTYERKFPQQEQTQQSFYQQQQSPSYNYHQNQLPQGGQYVWQPTSAPTQQQQQNMSYAMMPPAPPPAPPRGPGRVASGNSGSWVYYPY